MNSTDHDLIVRSQLGDLNAFRLLVEAHQRSVYALAFRMLFDAEEAREAAQESFIRVWQHLERIDAERPFTTWLYKVVVRLCLDKAKSRRKRRLVFMPLEESHEPAGGADIAAELETNELATAIRQIAGDLPEMQRTVFILRDLQDLSIEEIASVLGKSSNTIKVNLCYARKSIRQAMERREGRRQL